MATSGNAWVLNWFVARIERLLRGESREGRPHCRTRTQATFISCNLLSSKGYKCFRIRHHKGKPCRSTQGWRRGVWDIGARQTAGATNELLSWNWATCSSLFLSVLPTLSREVASSRSSFVCIHAAPPACLFWNNTHIHHKLLWLAFQLSD